MKVNKGMKKKWIEWFTFVIISYANLQGKPLSTLILQHAEALNSYQGLFALCKNFYNAFFNSFESLINFAASMKPDKHETKSTDFFATWSNVF